MSSASHGALRAEPPADSYPIELRADARSEARPAAQAGSSTLAGMDALTELPGSPFLGLGEVAALARRYCNLIETSGYAGPGWLGDVAAILPRLHAAMASIHRPSLHAVHDEPVDLDARFELYTQLRRLLGERDGYYLEFDRTHDGDSMTGSLADDLTDIYCELLAGLKVFRSHPMRALETWCLGFEHHWRRHLVDAERHLAALAAAGRLA